MAGLRGSGDPEGEFANDDEPASPSPAPQPPAPVAAPPAPPPPVVTPPSAAPAPVPPASAQVVLPPSAQQPLAPAPVTPAPALQAPAAQPAPTPAPTPSAVAQPAPAAQPQMSEEDVKRQWQTWRTESIKTLSQTSFALTDEQKQELELNPGNVLPTLAANVYMMALENCMAAVAEMLPQAIERHVTTRELYKRNEDDFYSAWPNLRPHAAQVGQIGVVFRQLNPGLSKEDFIKHVGEYAHMTLNVPKHTAAPAATPQPLRPHVPAAQGGAPRAAAVAPTNQNPFDVMAGRRGFADHGQGTIPDDDDENP